MRTLTCKHKIWGKNWLYLRPYLKALSVLETCSVYLLTTDLGIVKFIKEFIERFYKKMRNWEEWTELRAKTVTKEAESK